MRETACTDEVLFISRIAGLSAEVLEGLQHPDIEDGIAVLQRLDTAGRAERARLVELLHAAIHASERPVRRALLGVKRDAFNARPIRLPETDRAWRGCPEALDLVRRIATLDAAIGQAEEDLVRHLAIARGAERRHLVARLDDPAFARALALSTPAFFRAVDRLKTTPIAARDRKTRRLEGALLRFVSRAASKLSPFSTFTHLGLGRTVPASTPPRHVGTVRSTRSSLRLKRYLIDRALALAVANARVRAPLVTRLNDTARTIDTDTVRLLAPGRWHLDDDGRRFRYRRDRFVTLRLDGAWLERLRELSTPAAPWCDLVQRLARELEGSESQEVLDETDRLLQPWLDSGLLVLEWPWPSQTSHLEATAEAALANDHVSDHDALHEALAEVTRWQAAWGDATDPLAVLTGLDAAIIEWTRRAARIGGVDPSALDAEPSMKGFYYEDVFVADRSPERAETRVAEGTVFELSRSTVDDLFTTLDPVVRLAYLYNPRHDVLGSLAHRMEQLWPGGEPVPLLEVFHKVQPLWQAATRHQRDTRGARGGMADRFDPFGLDGIARLADFKQRLWDDAESWMVRRGDVLELDADRLVERLDTLPTGYRPAVGPCLLVQAVDTAGERWILNRLYEGVGRYASRFTAVMDEPERGRYTEHFSRRASIEVDETSVDLL
ncbi:MAG: hypothetical protein AAGE94_19745, partial [Acidobacteriota bacterium]